MEFFDSANDGFPLMDFFDGKLDSAKMDFLWWIFLMEKMIVHTMVHMMVNNDDAMMENNDVMNDGVNNV